MKQLSVLVLIGLVSYAALSAAQEIYSWTDEKGTVHFSDSLSQVPEKYRDHIQRKKIPQETPPASSPPSLSGPGKPKMLPKPTPDQVMPAGGPSPERKDILGRGEDWWKEQVREWRSRLSEAQRNHGIATADLKSKEKEIGDAKFKPDSLKRKLKAELKGLEEKVNACRKQVEEAQNMLDKGLPRQAAEHNADPNWLR